MSAGLKLNEDFHRYYGLVHNIMRNFFGQYCILKEVQLRSSRNWPFAWYSFSRLTIFWHSRLLTFTSYDWLHLIHFCIQHIYAFYNFLRSTTFCIWKMLASHDFLNLTYFCILQIFASRDFLRLNIFLHFTNFCIPRLFASKKFFHFTTFSIYLIFAF